MQHDRNLNRPVDVRALVAILRTCGDVNMISLLTKTTMHHSTRVQSRCMQSRAGCPISAREWAALAQPRVVRGVRLVRMLQWLDSTHIAKARRGSHAATQHLRCLSLCNFGDSCARPAAGEACLS